MVRNDKFNARAYSVAELNAPPLREVISNYVKEIAVQGPVSVALTGKKRKAVTAPSSDQSTLGSFVVTGHPVA